MTVSPRTGTTSNIEDLPLPCIHPPSTFESREYSRCDDSRKSLSDQQAGVEDGRAKCELFPRIPAAHEKHCSWKQRRFGDTEEETDGEERGRVSGESGGDGDA